MGNNPRPRGPGAEWRREGPTVLGLPVNGGPDGEEVTFTGSGGWKYWDDDEEAWVYGQTTVSLTVPEEE